LPQALRRDSDAVAAAASSAFGGFLSTTATVTSALATAAWDVRISAPGLVVCRVQGRPGRAGLQGATAYWAYAPECSHFVDKS
jgi:hypothetical protein